MDASSIPALLAKFGPLIGLKPEEAQPLWNACAARLKDLRAIVHGGQLSDGTTIPGIKELYAIAARIDGNTAHAREVLDASYRVVPNPPHDIQGAKERELF